MHTVTPDIDSREEGGFLASHQDAECALVNLDDIRTCKFILYPNNGSQ